jgi:hypothetical protein
MPKVTECSAVGKEQDLIEDPHLLQLRRTVSRALGTVAEEDSDSTHHPHEQHVQVSHNKSVPEMSWRRKGRHRALTENFVRPARGPIAARGLDYARLGAPELGCWALLTLTGSVSKVNHPDVAIPRPPPPRCCGNN